MSLKSRCILVASHLLLLLAGLLLAWGSSGHSNIAESDATPVMGQPSRSRPESTKANNSRLTRKWNGSQHARAWKAIRFAKLNSADRVKVQREMLKEWAEVDLASAIEAALGEAWDDDFGQGFGHPGLLLTALSDAMAKDPEASWEMIRGKQFGLATGLVRGVWINAIGAKNPLFLAARLGELSWRDQDAALSACDRGATDAQRSELLNILSQFPEDIVPAEKLMAFAQWAESDPADLKDEILALTATDQRMAKVKAMQLGNAIASQSAEEIEAMIQGLPAGIAQETLWIAFKNARPSESNLNLLDLMVEQEAWQKLESRETTGKIRTIASSHPAEVASWATSLPVRAETTELFHRSVEFYFRENLQNSRAWIDEIPPGYWQDRAYAEYSQVALNVHNDPEASAWALSNITDPAFRNTARTWREQWENRTGWKPK